MDGNIAFSDEKMINDSMDRRKGHLVVILMMWLCFLAGVLAVFYLSLMDGEETKALGQSFVEYLADLKFGDVEHSSAEMTALTYQFRQSGRIVAFFLIGIWGTMTMHASFYRRNWILRTAITTVVLLAIAYFTEELKVYIPGRHFSQEEMMLSITAVILGFSVVSIVTLIYHILKEFFLLLLTKHSTKHSA